MKQLTAVEVRKMEAEEMWQYLHWICETIEEDLASDDVKKEIERHRCYGQEDPLDGVENLMQQFHDFMIRYTVAHIEAFGRAPSELWNETAGTD